MRDDHFKQLLRVTVATRNVRRTDKDKKESNRANHDTITGQPAQTTEEPVCARMTKEQGSRAAPAARRVLVPSSAFPGDDSAQIDGAASDLFDER